jgi:hypothetical protein
MTRRATFTQAELARAIRAADKAGKVAQWTPAGIAFVDPSDLSQDTREIDQRGNTCDDLFAVKG